MSSEPESDRSVEYALGAREAGAFLTAGGAAFVAAFAGVRVLSAEFMAPVGLGLAGFTVGTRVGGVRRGLLAGLAGVVAGGAAAYYVARQTFVAGGLAGALTMSAVTAYLELYSDDGVTASDDQTDDGEDDRTLGQQVVGGFAGGAVIGAVGGVVVAAVAGLVTGLPWPVPTAAFAVVALATVGPETSRRRELDGRDWPVLLAVALLGGAAGRLVPTDGPVLATVVAYPALVAGGTALTYLVGERTATLEAAGEYVAEAEESVEDIAEGAALDAIDDAYDALAADDPTQARELADEATEMAERERDLRNVLATVEPVVDAVPDDEAREAVRSARRGVDQFTPEHAAERVGRAVDAATPAAESVLDAARDDCRAAHAALFEDRDAERAADRFGDAVGSFDRVAEFGATALDWADEMAPWDSERVAAERGRAASKREYARWRAAELDDIGDDLAGMHAADERIAAAIGAAEADTTPAGTADSGGRGEVAAAVATAREQFREGDYAAARETADEAIELAERRDRIRDVLATVDEFAGELDDHGDVADAAAAARSRLNSDLEGATDRARDAVAAAADRGVDLLADAEDDLAAGDGAVADGEFRRATERFAAAASAFERLEPFHEGVADWAETLPWDRDDVAGRAREARYRRRYARVREAKQRADDAADRGHDRLEAGAFSDAASAFGDAVESYQTALDRAAEMRGDGAATDELEVRVSAAERDLSTCESLADDARALAEFERRVDTAERALERDVPDTAAERFEAAVEDASDLPDRGPAVERLRERAQRGYVEAELAAGEARVASAADALEAGDHYEAREAFEAARTHLEDEVLALAHEYDFREYVAEIGELSETCRRQAEAARRELFGIADETVPAASGADRRTDAPRNAADGPASAAVGRELPDHEVRERIGGGGNADVYQVELAGGSVRALKVPRIGGTLSTEAAESFVEEARTWNKLDDHDHIVTVHDWGAAPTPWITMEYLPNGDLSERVGDLSVDRALSVALAVVGSVRHAHRLGVVHLDLKPENVLFDADDDPQVADWGMAETLLEHTDSVKGYTPRYAAPEQFDPDSFGGIDERTDIYQVGVVCYELLTGRPPVDGRGATVMRQVLEETPTPPSEIADVPPELDDVVATALATEKSDRYESILYLRDELDAVARTN